MHLLTYLLIYLRLIQAVSDRYSNTPPVDLKSRQCKEDIACVRLTVSSIIPYTT